MSMKNRTAIATAVVVMALIVVGVRAQDAATRTVWNGVYTDAQAERGEKVYAAQCASCHGAEMKAGAGAPSLAGPEFTFGWEKKPLGGLFDFIRANMPPGQAGALKDQEYADILSAMLRRNGFPASMTAELPSDKAQLDAITFVADKP
jgi:mono/diheme cytochrome c family protein